MLVYTRVFKIVFYAREKHVMLLCWSVLIKVASFVTSVTALFLSLSVLLCGVITRWMPLPMLFFISLNSANMLPFKPGVVASWGSSLNWTVLDNYVLHCDWNKCKSRIYGNRMHWIPDPSTVAAFLSVMDCYTSRGHVGCTRISVWDKSVIDRHTRGIRANEQLVVNKLQWMYGIFEISWNEKRADPV